MSSRLRDMDGPICDRQTVCRASLGESLHDETSVAQRDADFQVPFARRNKPGECELGGEEPGIERRLRRLDPTGDHVVGNQSGLINSDVAS